MSMAFNDQSSVPAVKGVVQRIPVETARVFYWSSYSTPTGPEITSPPYPTLETHPDKGFQETLLDAATSPAPIQYKQNQNQLPFRSVSTATMAITGGGTRIIHPAIPYLQSGIHLPPITAAQQYSSLILGRLPGDYRLKAPALFIATIQVYPNNALASCFAGFRSFRGNDRSTWEKFGLIHESVSTSYLSDTGEIVGFHFKGDDPSGTYRAYTKGGFYDQVRQFPGAEIGAGDTGWYGGNPITSEAVTTTKILWLPEGPDRGSPKAASSEDLTNLQAYNWTGGVYLGPGGPYALIGGYTDMPYRYVVRPFPDRQRRIGATDIEWEWFMGVVTSDDFTGTAGEVDLGPMVLRQLTVMEFGDAKGMGPLGSVLYL